MTRNAAFWIKRLKLTEHPEGGYFRETYRSDLAFSFRKGKDRRRNVCTSIYYLLRQGEFSAFHRIRSDEIWHFYAGGGLIIHELDKTGVLRSHPLGNDPSRKQAFQVMIPAGSWFAAGPLLRSAYSLVGCTVAPGFDFRDFELASAAELVSKYPKHATLIRRFCMQ
jgi:predicted cupin superfamily sugar epimerase